MKKAQVSAEYLMIVGIIFIAVITLFVYAMKESNDAVRINEAREFTDTLAKTADMVYALGPGSQDYVQAALPSSVESISISGNEISLKMRIFGGTSDVFSETKAVVNGSLSTAKGNHYVLVKAMENAVQIEE